MDRRNKTICIMSWTVIFAFIVWVALVDALSAPVSTPLTEHSEDLLGFQWRLIAGLTGLVQLLVGFIYVSGITSVKNSIRTLFTEIKELRDEKLDKADHDRLCDIKDKK